MKRILFVLLLTGLIGLGLPAGAQSKFSFQIKGGLNLADGGDFKTAGEGMFDLSNALLRAVGFTTSGSYSAPGLGPNFGADFIYKISPRFGLGLGAGYLEAGKSSVLELSSAAVSGNIAITPKVSAVPVLLSLYYFLPSSSGLSVYLRAGAGYYFAKGRLEEVVTGTSVSTDTFDVSGGGPGFHGGLGIEWALSPQFGILAELTGRYASLGGLDGTRKITGSSTETGKLWAYDVSAAAGTWHAIFVGNEAPSWSGVTNGREAKINLSGFSFVVGFFIRL